jgi:hypothetical protein
MNIYTILRKEMLRVLANYKSPGLRKKVSDYQKQFKTTGIIPAQVESEFPFSHKIVSEAIVAGSSIAKTTLREDFMILSKHLCDGCLPFLTKIANQITTTKEPTMVMQNITISELSYDVEYKYSGDIPVSVNILHRKSEFSSKKGMFYSGGKINIPQIALVPMLNNFHGEVMSPNFFVSRMADYSIYLIDNYFSFEVHANEKITIEVI